MRSAAALIVDEPKPSPEQVVKPRFDPEFLQVHEVLRGVTMMSPRPAPPHALVSSNLDMLLGPPYHKGIGGPGGWWILDEPELHLGEERLAPDVAGWRRERLPQLPTEAHFALVPDWVCEVLSPSTEETDRTEKLDIYAEYGVPFLWLANPLLRVLEVYWLGSNGSYAVKTYRGKRTVRVVPFDALPLDLGQLWPE